MVVDQSFKLCEMPRHRGECNSMNDFLHMLDADSQEQIVDLKD